MSPAKPVNQEAEYCETIESTFVSRRGSHMMLSNLDWQLMDEWQRRELPLHIVVSAINQVFDQRKSGQRTATINSLRYCAPAVEEAYRNWLANRVGANESAPEAARTRSNNPFSKESMLAHLKSRQEALRAAAQSVPEAVATGLAEVIEGVASGLTLIQLEVEADRLNAQTVESLLAKAEEALDATIKAAATAEALTEHGRAVTSMLAPHRANLTDEIYQQQFNNFLIKRLRESFGIPRLSLFFAK